MTLELPKERNLFFSEQVDQKTVLELSKGIVSINENDDYLTKVYAASGIEFKRKPINIYIDSYGGHVYQILGLAGIIAKSKTPVHTIVTGCAMSAGFILLICGHRRYAYEHATILYHELSSRVDGNVQTFRDEMIELERLQKLLDDITLRQTKIKPERLRKVRDRKKDWYFTSEEALKLNVIDKII